MNIGLPPLKLSVEVDGALGLGPDGQEDIDAAMQAFRTAATLAGEFIRGVWLQVAGAMDIRGGFSGAGATTYLQGIRSAVVSIESETIGTNHAEIVIVLQNTSPHAGLVEEGHAAFSLVRAIDWGSTTGRIKRGKNGPYLHIPFRHTTYQSPAQADDSGMTYASRKAMMPRDVTLAARKLAATIRHNAGPVYRHQVTMVNGVAHASRQFVQADRYTWGDRLRRPGSTAIAVAPAGVDHTGRPFAVALQERRGARNVGRDASGRMLKNPAWQTGRFDNLFRTSQPGGGSTYMTIRTITPNSRGWNIPAMVGRHVAKRVATALQSGVGAAELQRILSEPFGAALGLEVDNG